MRMTWRISTPTTFTALLWAAAVASAQPGVFVTAEGQLGGMPGPDDKVAGVRFEPVRGQAEDVLLGGLFVFGGAMPPPPEFSFLTDRIHGDPDPMPVGAVSDLFSNVFKLPPASARSRNATDDGDFVAFSFAVDGTLPQTMTVRVATYDETGNALVEIPILNVETFFVPEAARNDTGVAVDDQGRVTVVYTELDLGVASVKAQRIDGVTGAILDPAFPVTGPDRTNVDVALLDPAGERLIVSSTDFVAVRGNVVDFSGSSPLILPEFPISTTAALANFNPVVAADPATGAYTVAWEHATGALGNPVDVRARRFDAMGNAIGGDFIVNTTTAEAQGQPAVAYGLGGNSVVVWAGDAAVAQDELDVFAQAYDAAGNPIGGEIRVNTFTENVQDQPWVRFLPEPDAAGQPQFVVTWRDVGTADGSLPRGTGTGYKCFSIGEDPAAIFADGFESGNTSSWSARQP